ncbi:hypothetical protein C2E23DRAFT_699808, partial [Lenzites betulinus]
MRIDGTTRSHTMLDDETGGVLLRRLHPRIANYNDLVIFLIKSNMDIKFIGSGEAAKALLYYVTDYITKPSLPAHVGLAALSYAIQKTNERFPSMVEDNAFRPKGALNTAVNRMMAHQEISHQQVMSYLVGGGDVYTSHKFRVLHWSAFDRLFREAFSERVRDDGSAPIAPSHSEETEGAVEDDQEDGETFTLQMQAGSISSMSQQQDYVYRCIDDPFEALCLYQFVSCTKKESLRRDESRRLPTRTERSSMDALPYVGRDRLPRGSFSSSVHTQQSTHILRITKDFDVPVILGNRIPRSDRGDEEREDWARMMLILFVPWRRPSDIRRIDETWIEAFERQRHRISPEHEKVIVNMNVLSECRDVRDSLSALRRAEALALLREGGTSGDTATHTGLGEENIAGDYQLFDDPNSIDMFEGLENQQATQGHLDGKIGSRAREILDMCYSSNEDICMNTGRHTDIGTRIRVEDDDPVLFQHNAVMRELKKLRRPQFSNREGQGNGRARQRRRTTEVIESVSRAALTDTRNIQAPGSASVDDESGAEPGNMIDRVVREFDLSNNPEQERAFRIIAEHAHTGSGQLLMYIAGVGGTGKTHVIRAVLRYFELL